jgi:hypothetical protein
MIPLPPGCKLVHSIFFELPELSDDIIRWFENIGGEVMIKEHINNRGHVRHESYVKYGKGKVCYRRQDGSDGVRIHFHGDDASVASMFLIKFMDLIEQHNLKEHMEMMNE